MKTQCPNCNQDYEVDDNFLGATVSCEVCKQDFVVQKMVEVNKESQQSKKTNGLKHCTSCGNIVAKDAVSCPNCGAQLKKKKHSCCLGIIVLVIFIFTVIAHVHNKASQYAKEQTGKRHQSEYSDTYEKKEISGNPEELYEQALAAYNRREFNSANAVYPIGWTVFLRLIGVNVLVCRPARGGAKPDRPYSSGGAGRVLRSPLDFV